MTRDQYLFPNAQRFDYLPRAPLTRCGWTGRGSLWGAGWGEEGAEGAEGASGDWYIRRSAAERVRVRRSEVQYRPAL